MLNFYKKTLLFLLLLTPFIAVAAKFPNSVSKKFVFEGEAATKIALLLGIDPRQALDKRLRLNSSDEWAVYLRDTPKPDASSSAVERPRHNTVSYVPSTPAYLSISGDWLDSKTGSSPSQPQFHFSSPFIPEGGIMPNWDFILKKHLDGQSVKMDRSTLFERREGNFKLSIYRSQNYLKNPQGEWGYIVQISAE